MLSLFGSCESGFVEPLRRSKRDRASPLSLRGAVGDVAIRIPRLRVTRINLYVERQRETDCRDHSFSLSRERAHWSRNDKLGRLAASPLPPCCLLPVVSSPQQIPFRSVLLRLSYLAGLSLSMKNARLFSLTTARFGGKLVAVNQAGGRSIEREFERHGPGGPV